MSVTRNTVDAASFNRELDLPFELGTRTATLHRDGIRKLRDSWVYRAG